MNARATHPNNSYRSLILLIKPLVALMCLLVTDLRGANTSNVLTISANSTQEEIQTALDRSPEGGEVLLAPGTYPIYSPLILWRDHVTLRGSGPGTILRLADKANCPVVILGSPLTSSGHATTQLTLADLVIDGNRLNQQTEFWRSATDGSQLNNNGIDVWEVNDSTVESVTCHSCRSGGLVTAVTKQLTVHDFTAFDNQFDGLACYQTEESHFSGLNLHDNLAAGISLDLSFNHNVISDAELTANDLGVFMRNSRDNVFQDLTITKSKNYGVFMAQTAGVLAGVWQLCPGTECTGNKFEGLTITNCGGKAFLIKDPACTDNTVQEARFVANTRGDLPPSGEKLVSSAELLQP
jgi:Periplasmic copper-binding protein (NosD)